MLSLKKRHNCDAFRYHMVNHMVSKYCVEYLLTRMNELNMPVHIRSNCYLRKGAFHYNGKLRRLIDDRFLRQH